MKKTFRIEREITKIVKRNVVLEIKEDGEDLLVLLNGDILVEITYNGKLIFFRDVADNYEMEW